MTLFLHLVPSWRMPEVQVTKRNASVRLTTMLVYQTDCYQIYVSVEYVGIMVMESQIYWIDSIIAKLLSKLLSLSLSAFSYKNHFLVFLSDFVSKKWGARI